MFLLTLSMHTGFVQILKGPQSGPSKTSLCSMRKAPSMFLLTTCGDIKHEKDCHLTQTAWQLPNYQRHNSSWQNTFVQDNCLQRPSKSGRSPQSAYSGVCCIVSAYSYSASAAFHATSRNCSFSILHILSKSPFHTASENKAF